MIKWADKNSRHPQTETTCKNEEGLDYFDCS